MEKESNSDESDFGEREKPCLNSLKPFKFEPKTNIGDIISSSSDDEEEGAEHKVKRISNNEWCECSAKAFLGICFLFIYLLTLFNVNYKTLAAHALIKIDVFQNRCQACNFIKMRLQHRCFPMKFTKSLRTPFLQNTSTLMAATGSKQCKPMKTHTESLCC